MEVVVLGVADADKENDQVNDGCARPSVKATMGPRGGVCTLRRGVLAKVLLLVLAEDALGLDLGGGTSGEFLVEADDTLHADSIRGGANGLSLIHSGQFSNMISQAPSGTNSIVGRPASQKSLASTTRSSKNVQSAVVIHRGR